jgi:hypothetical protein
MEGFECPICMEVLKKPVTVACGAHNICLECHRSYLLTQQRERKTPLCPSCRGAMQSDASKLQVNRLLEEAIKLVVNSHGGEGGGAVAPSAGGGSGVGSGAERAAGGAAPAALPPPSATSSSGAVGLGVSGQPSAPGAPDAPPPQWACLACTFLNSDMASVECEVCKVPRGAAFPAGGPLAAHHKEKAPRQPQATSSALLALPSLPPGLQVVRGPSWQWRDQDNYTSVGITSPDEPGWVRVAWAHNPGNPMSYRWDPHCPLGAIMDVIPLACAGSSAAAAPAAAASGGTGAAVFSALASAFAALPQAQSAPPPGLPLVLAPGTRVKRGPTWKWCVSCAQKYEKASVPKSCPPRNPTTLTTPTPSTFCFAGITKTGMAPGQPTLIQTEDGLVSAGTIIPPSK